jgi:hypothetical protein
MSLWPIHSCEVRIGTPAAAIRVPNCVAQVMEDVRFDQHRRLERLAVAAQHARLVERPSVLRVSEHEIRVRLPRRPLVEAVQRAGAADPGQQPQAPDRAATHPSRRRSATASRSVGCRSPGQPVGATRSGGTSSSGRHRPTGRCARSCTSSRTPSASATRTTVASRPKCSSTPSVSGAVARFAALAPGGPWLTGVTDVVVVGPPVAANQHRGPMGAGWGLGRLRWPAG